MEVEALREMLKHATGSPVGDIDIHDKLAESENLMKQGKPNTNSFQTCHDALRTTLQY